MQRKGWSSKDDHRLLGEGGTSGESRKILMGGKNKNETDAVGCGGRLEGKAIMLVLLTKNQTSV